MDDTEIFLDGGYDKEAGHRTALAASLSALVLWPLIFIRGKEAVLMRELFSPRRCRLTHT